MIIMVKNFTVTECAMLNKCLSHLKAINMPVIVNGNHKVFDVFGGIKVQWRNDIKKAHIGLMDCNDKTISIITVGSNDTAIFEITDDTQELRINVSEC